MTDDEMAYLQAVADALRADLRAVKADNETLMKTVLENAKRIQELNAQIMEMTR